jgi:hypothetical protein
MHGSVHYACKFFAFGADPTCPYLAATAVMQELQEQASAALSGVSSSFEWVQVLELHPPSHSA